MILHGVTSAWTLNEVLKHVSSEKDKLEAIRVLLAIILMAYVGQGRPRLLLDKLNCDYELPLWDEIIQKAFSLKRSLGDEHVFKIIQVRKLRKVKNKFINNYSPSGVFGSM